MCPPPQMYGRCAISLPALTIACTCGGASTGAIASRFGVSVAWSGSALKPLWESSCLISVSDVGCGSVPLEAGELPTLTDDWPLLADATAVPPAPATGSIACGCGAGTELPAARGALERDAACCPHPAHANASAAIITTVERTRSVWRARPLTGLSQSSK